MSSPKLVRLKPFPLLHELHTKSFRVWAGAETSASELRLFFKIEAASPKEFVKVHLPGSIAGSDAQRKKELWKDTCCEVFIPSAHSNAYLEFNGSPNGDWDWYSFRDYREGMVPFQLSSDAIPVQRVYNVSPSQVEVEWTLPLIGIRQGFQSVGENHHEVSAIGLSVVLNTTVATTYWALTHEGLKPDFHLKSSFVYQCKGSD